LQEVVSCCAFFCWTATVRMLLSPRVGATYRASMMIREAAMMIREVASMLRKGYDFLRPASFLLPMMLGACGLDTTPLVILMVLCGIFGKTKEDNTHWSLVHTGYNGHYPVYYDRINRPQEYVLIFITVHLDLCRFSCGQWPADPQFAFSSHNLLFVSCVFWSVCSRGVTAESSLEFF
jgi:hypothetical protein